MNLIWLLLLVAIVMIGLPFALQRLKSDSRRAAPVAFPYESATLLSPAERSFFGALEQAVDGRCIVLCKVRLGDLMQVRRGLSRSESTSARNRINMKHVDFVLCAKETVSPVAVIELDDKSHAAPSRKERDTFVDKALSAAGIRCFHVPAAASYSVHELRRMLDEALGDRADHASDAPAPAAAPRAPESADAHVRWGRESRDANRPATSLGAATPEAREGSTERPPSIPVGAHDGGATTLGSCPECGSELVERVAKRGKNRGNTFVACSAFPACRYTESS